MDKVEILLSLIKVGTHTSENRFFVQAMECTDADAEGDHTDLNYQRHENLFKGEAGIVSLEAITITDKNRGCLNQLFIMPKNKPALTRFVGHLKKDQPEKDLCFPAYPFRRAEQPGILNASLGETPAGIHSGCIHQS